MIAKPDERAPEIPWMRIKPVCRGAVRPQNAFMGGRDKTGVIAGRPKPRALSARQTKWMRRPIPTPAKQELLNANETTAHPQRTNATWRPHRNMPRRWPSRKPSW